MRFFIKSLLNFQWITGNSNRLDDLHNNYSDMVDVSNFRKFAHSPRCCLFSNLFTTRRIHGTKEEHRDTGCWVFRKLNPLDNSARWVQVSESHPCRCNCYDQCNEEWTATRWITEISPAAAATVQILTAAAFHLNVLFWREVCVLMKKLSF